MYFLFLFLLFCINIIYESKKEEYFRLLKFVKNVHDINPRSGGTGMISNQILQNTIDGLKGISKVDFSVLDTEGKELASTLDNAQERNSAVISFVESPADSQVIQGCQFFKIFDEQQA